MNNTVTQLLYNMIISQGEAKNIAKKLSINYATLMRELNIYDDNAKLGIERFLQITSVLENNSPLEYIVNLFGYTLVYENKTISFQNIDPILINNLLAYLYKTLREIQDIEKLLILLKKPYSRVMKELNIYDPNAKLGIETFITILFFTKDIKALVLFIEIAEHQIKLQ